MVEANNPQNHARHQPGLTVAFIILISAVALMTSPIRESSAQADAPSWSYTGKLKSRHSGNYGTAAMLLAVSQLGSWLGPYL